MEFSPWIWLALSAEMFAHRSFYPNYIICENVENIHPKNTKGYERKYTYSFEIMRNILFCDMKSLNFIYKHVLKLPLYS
jgi:hypothetical protein